MSNKKVMWQPGKAMATHRGFEIETTQPLPGPVLVFVLVHLRPPGDMVTIDAHF